MAQSKNTKAIFSLMVGFTHRLVGIISCLLLFVVFFVASVLVHGRLPATRRLAAQLTTELLKPVFEGQIVIGEVKGIGFRGITVADAEVLAPDGRRVLAGRDLYARVNLFDLAQNAISTSGPFIIPITQVSISEAEVNLDRMPGDDIPAVGRAFFPRKKAVTTTTELPKPRGRETRVELPEIQIHHVVARGSPAVGLDIEADLFRIPAKVTAGAEGVFVDIEQTAVVVHSFGLLRPRGLVEYHLSIIDPGSLPPKMNAKFLGEMGDIPVQATASLVGRTLEANAAALKVSPTQLKNIWPSSPLLESVAIEATANGPLPDLKLHSRVVSGPTSIDVDAVAHVATPLRVDAGVKVIDFDPRLITKGTAPASISAEGTVIFELPEGAPVVLDLSASTYDTSYAGIPIPPTSTRIKLEEQELRGTVAILERGAKIEGEFAIDRQGTIRASLDSTISSLLDVPRLGGKLSGGARLHAAGLFTKEGELDVQVDAQLSQPVVSSVKAKFANLRARVMGPPASLELAATALIDQVEIGPVHFGNTNITLDGPLLSPTLDLQTDGNATLLASPLPPIHASVPISLTDGVSSHGGQITIGEGQLLSTIEFRSIEIGKKSIVIQGVHSKGAMGEVLAHAEIDEDGIDISAFGQLALNHVPTVPVLLGIEGGTLGIEINVHTGMAPQSAHILLDASDVKFRKFPIVTSSARLSMDVLRNHVQSEFTAETAWRPGEPIVKARAGLDGTLPGSVTDPMAWRHLYGQADINQVFVDMNRINDGLALKEIFLKGKVKGAPTWLNNIARTQGDISGNFTLVRGPGEALPHANGFLRTRDFELTLNGVRETPWTLRGIAATVQLTVGDADTRISPNDKLPIRLITTLREPTLQPLVEIHTNTYANLEHLFGKILGSVGITEEEPSLKEELLALPLDGYINLAKNEMVDWPEVIRPNNVKGKVSFRTQLSGTIGSPEALLQAQASEIVVESEQLASSPFYVAAQGVFKGHDVDLRVSIGHSNSPVGEISVLGEFFLPEMLRGQATRPWSIDTDIRLMNFPLDAFPQLTYRGISGRVTGYTAIHDLHVEPVMDADFFLMPPSAASVAKLFGAPVKQARLKANERSGELSAKASVLQPTTLGDGELDVDALLVLAFEEGLIPSLETAAQQSITAVMRGFDAGPLAIEPSDVFADFGGLLDGQVKATLEPFRQDGHDINVSGKVEWRHGKMSVPVLGQSFKQGKLSLLIDSNKEFVSLAASDISVAAASGSVLGSMTLGIPKGIIRYGLFGEKSKVNLETELNKITGYALAEIPEQHKIPVTFEGVPLGDASGRAQILLRRDSSNGYMVHVAIPTLLFELPERKTRDVQDLAANPQVGVVHTMAENSYSIKKTSTPITIMVGLGHALDTMISDTPRRGSGRVAVRRSGVDVELSGTPVVSLTDKLRIKGVVEAVRGRLNALGKPFELEEAIVRFEGDDPTNPFVNARARWDTTDGIRVFVEVYGRAKQVKIRFRSEPARPESEVIGLVLFGRDINATQQPGADPNQNSQNTLAVGGGVASTVLNSLLDPVEVFGRRIETRVDTSSSQNTRIGVATEVRPNLWAQVDVSTANQQNRGTSSDTTTLSLDWRFFKKWSLKTSLGDRGSTSVDVVWQYRY